MALATYADLVAAIDGWLSRSDMGTIAPDLIRLAEAEFNRTLRTMDMEKRASVVLTGDAVALPANFLGLRSIAIGRTLLDYVNPSEVFDDETTGIPCRYTVTDGQFFFRPAPTSGTVTITYFEAITGLSSGNPTNWLLTKHPDLYLFASLAQAEFYNWNDDRLPIVKARTEEIIGQINAGDQKERYGGRRLVMNSGVANVGIAA